MMRKKGGPLRHLEGWEVGVVAVVIALVGTLLAVPLPVAPRDVPVPLADGKALLATFNRERAMAASIAAALEEEHGRSSGTSELYDLRAFGQEFRAYGAAEASGDTYAVVRARQRLTEAVARARGVGDDKLVALRAYQQQLFLAELRKWENAGVSSDELSGLGGGFLDLVRKSGWLTGTTIVMDDVVRGIFFKRRWNQVTGISGPPYAISLDEHRTFYAFLLTHPYVEGRGGLDAKDACRVADQWRLRKIEELARLDPFYPYVLARGVLFYRLGRYPEAAQAFRDHLGTADDGRYALRARNYLATAVARSVQEP
ncbi:MAG TPA: hypothetical protein VK540_14880 [Polyangiaceae bacterium]|nr:hypothetical protein [Polyangiaceae bacterium]